MDMAASKAELVDGEETDDKVFVQSVPTGKEEAAKAAAEACPVDAITIYNSEGEQLRP